jgi:hypothetical protein
MFRLFLGVVLGFILAAMPALASGPVGKQVNGKNVNPTVQQIDQKIAGQMMKIQSALNKGKITRAQAKTLKDGLQAVRKKEAGFFKQNKKHILTAEQQGQLDQMLLDNARNMPPDPLEINAAKKMPVDPLEKNKKMPVGSMDKMKLNRPPDPLEKNKKKLPDDPIESQGANVQ